MKPKYKTKKTLLQKYLYFLKSSYSYKWQKINCLVDDKMECYSDQCAFVTLKDHKENFKSNTKCRLINPSKSEVGLVSKTYLNDIIAEVSKKSGVNQWRSTSAVIKSFKALPNKHSHKFIKFDIAEFYPSISEKLLDKSIEYAKSFIDIEDKVIYAIKLERRSLLFNKDGTWI